MLGRGRGRGRTPQSHPFGKGQSYGKGSSSFASPRGGKGYGGKGGGRSGGFGGRVLAGGRGGKGYGGTSSPPTSGGTLDLSSLVDALPTLPTRRDDGQEVDPGVHRRRAAVKMIMDASADEQKVPPTGDSSPLGYCKRVVRETLFEHRALLGQCRIHDTEWARWPPRETSPADKGQHANTLIVLADSFDVREVSLVFVTYSPKEERYNLCGSTCSAAEAFGSCFNHFAEQQLQGGVTHKRIDADNCAYFQPIEYIGDGVAAIEACLLLQQQPTPTALFLAVANPRERKPADWRKPPLTNQLNSSQLSALTSLTHGLEVIQGPPGTGKSTTIYQLVKHCMPPGVKSVVCAVQNRAVEAICQRLAGAEGELSFFVIGNDKRLAETSKQWTLAAQANRDARVLHERAVAQKATTLDKLVTHGLKLYTEKVFGGLSLSQHRAARARELRRLIDRGAPLHPYGEYRPDTSSKDTTCDFEQYFEAHDGWKKLAEAYTKNRVGKRPEFKLGGAAHLHRFFKITERDAEMRAAQLFHQVKEEIARDASVMLCTAATVGPQVNSADENVAKYMKAANALVVDEAGTCPDRSIVPLLPYRDSGSCFGRAVLVGDEKQLPPFSRLDESVRNASLLERAVSKVGGHMLTTQYRMPPSLCRVVSDAFYDGQLATAETKTIETNQKGGPCIVFDPIDGEAKSNGRSRSLFNEEEAEAAVMHALRLKREHPNWSVAAITFYKQQFKLISEYLEQFGGESTAEEISVLSVDAAQGQEFDAVVLSAVVDGSRPSFLRDERRQCVGISRAKQRFIIVASPHLCHNMKIFRSLRDAAQAR